MVPRLFLGLLNEAYILQLIKKGDLAYTGRCPVANPAKDMGTVDTLLFMAGHLYACVTAEPCAIMCLKKGDLCYESV